MPGPTRGDRAAAERALADLLRALGLDAGADPELADTAKRAADFHFETTSGLDPGAEPELAVMPHAGDRQLVAARGLRFHSICVHHLAPFFGRALIAYLPDRHLLGIGALPRVLDFHARRPQLQERLGAAVADHLERAVRPLGVAVLLEARHLCMEMRGERRRARIETRVVRGELAEARWAEALRFRSRTR